MRSYHMQSKNDTSSVACRGTKITTEEQFEKEFSYIKESLLQPFIDKEVFRANQECNSYALEDLPSYIEELYEEFEPELMQTRTNLYNSFLEGGLFVKYN